MSPDTMLANVNSSFLLLICGLLSAIVPFSWGQQKSKSDHFVCPEEFGYHPHPTDCAQYYVCVFGEAVLESCTGGLMYSHDLQTCDWPRNVGCANSPSAPESDALINGNAALPPLQDIRSRQKTPLPLSPTSSSPSSPSPPSLWNQEVVLSRQQQQQQIQQDTSIPDKNLYEDDIGPVEEIETDRQQRVYRGQPPTLGQVARDRDGISRHTNALQTSAGPDKVKPVAVISFSSHHQNISKLDNRLIIREVVDNFLTTTPPIRTGNSDRYKRSLDLRPPESVSTYILEPAVSQSPTPTRTTYNISQFEPYYGSYDEDVELYRDIDYTHYRNDNSNNNNNNNNQGKHQSNTYQVIQHQPTPPQQHQQQQQTRGSQQLFTRQPIYDTQDYHLQKEEEDGQLQQSEKQSSSVRSPSPEVSRQILASMQNRGPSTFPPLYYYNHHPSTFYPTLPPSFTDTTASSASSSSSIISPPNRLQLASYFSFVNSPPNFTLPRTTFGEIADDDNFHFPSSTSREQTFPSRSILPPPPPHDDLPHALLYPTRPPPALLPPVLPSSTVPSTSEEAVTEKKMLVKETPKVAAKNLETILSGIDESRNDDAIIRQQQLPAAAGNNRDKLVEYENVRSEEITVTDDDDDSFKQESVLKSQSKIFPFVRRPASTSTGTGTNTTTATSHTIGNKTTFKPYATSNFSPINLPSTTTPTTPRSTKAAKKPPPTTKRLLLGGGGGEPSSFRIVVQPVSSLRKLIKGNDMSPHYQTKINSISDNSPSTSAIAANNNIHNFTAITITDTTLISTTNSKSSSVGFTTTTDKPSSAGLTISNSRKFYISEPYSSAASSPSPNLVTTTTTTTAAASNPFKQTASSFKFSTPSKLSFPTRVPSTTIITDIVTNPPQIDQQEEDHRGGKDGENEIHYEELLMPTVRDNKRGPKDYSNNRVNINNNIDNYYMTESSIKKNMLNQTASTKLKTIIKSALLYTPSNNVNARTNLHAAVTPTLIPGAATTVAAAEASAASAGKYYAVHHSSKESNNNKFEPCPHCNDKSYVRGRNRGSITYTTAANEFDHVTPGNGKGRPTLKPPTSIVSKAVEIDIYKFAPKRPDPIYPAPEPDKTAAKCRPDICLLPDCSCGGKDIPADLPTEETPQIVLLTFDDSVNELNKGLYADLFEKGRTNPNGCPISATFYVSHEWTDYSMVQNLYATGHEIASHSVSHSFGEQFSTRKWSKEVTGQREILSAYGGVRQEDIRGMRAPFLAIGGNKMFKMLYDANFTYDSSMPIYENKPPSWPYTLDYKIFHDCMIPPCPTRSYPGVWEVPMVMWQDLNGGRCSMGDACSNPSEADGVFKMLNKNFERHFTTNRAPFGLFYHSSWFTQAHHKEGFIAFLDRLVAMPEVWIITNWQAIQWIRDPTPMSKLNNFPPFGCDYAERPRKCNNPKVCNLWHKSGVRYLKTCQPCPDVYPWTGKTGVRNTRIDNEDSIAET